MHINPEPLMTQFLVKEGFFKDEPFVIIDVGARGGLAPHWNVLNPSLLAFCFEPDEAECARLNASAPENVRYIPKGLADVPGKQILNITALPDSSGLYANDMRYFGRFVNADNGRIIEQGEIECTTLTECLKDGIPHPDFLKLDAEGAESDIWRGAKGLLKPLGILTEIRFHTEINRSHAFYSMDKSMRISGYHLYDLTFSRQSRKDLPYPQTVRSIAQDGRQFMGITTRGQIQDGDALYFRDLFLPHESPAIATMSMVNVLKMACLMEIYSLNDCAAELILARWPNPTECLDLLASGIAGERTTYEAYRKRYFG